MTARLPFAAWWSAFGAACRRHGFAWIAGWLVVVAVPLSLGIVELDRAARTRDLLDDATDPYGEADNVRAADGWLARGFGFGKGLPEIGYGERFERIGGKHDPEMCASRPDCVYLHNPQGSALVTYVGMRAFGPERLSKVRTVPVWIFVAATLLFLVAVARRLGSARAALVAGVVATVPMYANMAHGLCYHGLSLSFLFVLWASLLARRARVAALGVAIASFVLGTLAYENAFVCAFSPLAFAAFRGLRRRPTIVLCLVAGLGFTLAQVVHFAEVVAYLGGLGPALADLGAAGHKRTVAQLAGRSAPLGAGELVADYLFKHVPKPEFASLAFVPVYVVAFLLSFVRAPLRGTAFRFAPPRGAAFALAIGFVAPLVWIVLLRQHATIHTHFLPRMFTLPLTVAALVAVASFRRRIGPAEAHERRG